VHAGSRWIGEVGDVDRRRRNDDVQAALLELVGVGDECDG
jgi:hypothetical protein